MGMLDFVPMKEPEYIPKKKKLIKVRCEKCGVVFDAGEGILRGKQRVFCNNCWGFRRKSYYDVQR